jgi:hypothetical protein
MLLLLSFILVVGIEDHAADASPPSAHSYPEQHAQPPSNNDVPDERGPTLRVTSHSGRSPIEPPIATDEVFVADEGGYLDQYLFREDVPDGKLIFNIYVDQGFS